MSRRTLAFAVFSTLVLATGACNSPLDVPGTVSASQGADNPVTDDRGLPAPADSLANPSRGGADDPANHDVGDDRGVDDPATHDVGDDHGGNRGDNGSGRGGADDPANHQ